MMKTIYNMAQGCHFYRDLEKRKNLKNNRKVEKQSLKKIKIRKKIENVATLEISH